MAGGAAATGRDAERRTRRRAHPARRPRGCPGRARHCDCPATWAARKCECQPGSGHLKNASHSHFRAVRLGDIAAAKIGDDAGGRALLAAFGFPFRKDGQ